MSTHRIERINTLIRREISELIQQHARDPRLDEFVIVTGVDTSPDLSYSKIFVSCVSGKQKEQQILAALDSASGFLRSELAKKIRLRHMPALQFHWDSSIERGDHILQLLDQLGAEKQE
jgi:ribosome-binding factor A